MVKHYGGSFCNNDALIKHEKTVILSNKESDPKTILDDTEIQEASSNAKKRALAMCFQRSR